MKVLPLLFILSALVVPELASAQLVTCEGVDCTACSFVETVNTVVNFLITLCVVIAVALIAVAGFKLVTSGGNANATSEAKQIFTNVVIGFIIVLAAWLIIDTILRIATNTGGLDAWGLVNCGGQTQPTPGSPGFFDGVGSRPAPTAEGTITEGSLSHDEAVSRLEAAGITVTSTAGPSGVRAGCSGTGCTSLTNLRNDTVGQLEVIAAACPSCEFKATGFTEGGPHATAGSCTHGNGCKADIDDNEIVDKFFFDNLTPAGTRGADSRYVDKCGNEYVREKTHWDISVSRGVCSF